MLSAKITGIFYKVFAEYSSLWFGDAGNYVINLYATNEVVFTKDVPGS